jgi:hypothetical protein
LLDDIRRASIAVQKAVECYQDYLARKAVRAKN